MIGIVTYRTVGKATLTGAILLDAALEIQEEEGDYVSDLLTIAEAGGKVGALWYGEVLIGMALTHPATYVGLGFVVTGAVVSYGINGWQGLEDYGEFLGDVWEGDVGEVADKTAFAINTLVHTVATNAAINLIENPLEIQYAKTNNEIDTWSPQPYLPIDPMWLGGKSHRLLGLLLA